MVRCSVCKADLKIAHLSCHECGLELSGEYHFPRLMRLPHEMLALAEELLLAGGNLKDLAVKLDISYPTLRKRLDDLIEKLAALRKQDQVQADNILKAMEHGEISPQKGMRLIKEINGEL